MIPLYGFLEGDTIGLLIAAYEDETIRDLADKLQQSARVRVKWHAKVRVIHRGRALDQSALVRQVGLEPLERFDVVRDED